MEIDLVLVYGYEIRDLMKQVKIRVGEEIEQLTALNIKSLKLLAKSLVLEHHKKVN